MSPVTPTDTAKLDSLHREDLRLVQEARRKADSIKTPTPASESPRTQEYDGALRWGRDEILSVGAVTLGDLLQRVPGVTVFRTGWLGNPEQASYAGDVGRVRIFQDGLELIPLDPRNQGSFDLSVIQLWPLEEVRIERGASELRIHLRSWRLRSTTPETRVDVGTGDAETNAYRGYFGRRFGGGQAFQVGGSQFTVRDTRGVGDADQSAYFGRLGWARGRFGFDAVMQRTSRTRTAQPRLVPLNRADLPAIDASYGEAYVRAAYNDTSAGIWVQGTVGQLQHHRARDNSATTATGAPNPDSVDIDVALKQYVLAGGWTHGALALSATSRRLMPDSGKAALSTLVRGTFEKPRWVLGAIAERRGDVDLSRYEGFGIVRPNNWLAVSAAAANSSAGVDAVQPSATSVRAELAARIHRIWVAGGALRTDSMLLAPLAVFDTGFRSISVGPTTGLFASVRGKFWRDVGLDMSATQWNSDGFYRPRQQVRTRLYLDSDMRNRYPSGNLHILIAVEHEYRASAFFPLSKAPGAASDPAPLKSSEFRYWSLVVEIRLLQATINFQMRNLLAEQYEQVPGFVNMRPVSFYGVRWYFFN